MNGVYTLSIHKSCLCSNRVKLIPETIKSCLYFENNFSGTHKIPFMVMLKHDEDEGAEHYGQTGFKEA